MAVTLGQMDWRLGVDNADFQNGLANAEKQAKGFGANITKALATGAKVAFGAAVVGVGALGAVLAQSVKEASAAEEITAQLNSTIKSTGGIAGVSAKAIQDHALALSQVTRFEDDAIVEAETMLLTFTKIGKDVFPQATKATLNLATRFKMDLASASKMVGKALNDPIAGLTAMGRAGVQFTKDQKEMIKAMVEAGDIAGAQAIILKELEVQAGGAAEAAGKTMAGQMDILKNALGNVKDEIGGALIPILKDLITWAGPRLIAGFQKFSDWVRTGLGDIRQLAGTLGKAKDMIGEIIADVKAGEKIEWQDLMNLAGLFTNQVDIKRKFSEIVTDIHDGIYRIVDAFRMGGIGTALGEVGEMIGEAFNKVDWEKVKTNLVTAANKAMSTITVAWDKLVVTVKEIDWEAVHAEVLKLSTPLGEWYREIFLDENKQAQLAWDIQNYIKGAFTIASAEIENGTVVDKEALWSSIAEAMRGPTAPTQDFVGQILDYMFPDAAAFGERMHFEVWDALASKIDNIKAALAAGRKERSQFEIDFAKAFSNPFQAIADVINAVAIGLKNVKEEKKLLDDELAKGIPNPFQGISDAVSSIVQGIWDAIGAYMTLKNLFGGSGLPAGSGGNIGGVNGANSNSRGPQGDYGNTNTRGMSGNGNLTPITVNVYAAGGGPEFVRKAANQGVNEALRARGYR